MFEKAIVHFQKSDPLLYKLAKSIDPPSVNLQSQDHFLRLTRAIVGQQLSVKAASTIFTRFQNLFKNKITPERIVEMDKEKIRECGISYPKISYIKDLAEKVIEKKLILENIHEEDDATVIENLTIVKGIGAWSAEMFLMFSLGRPDVFSVGDLGLKNAIKKLYKLNEVSNADLIKISAKWSPYRTYACMILWRSLDNEPK